MKRKHGSLIIIVIVLISVLAGVLWLSNSPEKSRIAGPSLIYPEQQVTIPVPGRETIKEMKRLETIMPQLINPAKTYSSQAQLGLFGFYPYAGGDAGATGKKTEFSPHIDYSLSLAFWGSEKRFCVIDDKFYHEGASLPDGGSIAKIELNRVLIEKHGFTGWITLEPQTDMTNNLEESGDTM